MKYKFNECRATGHHWRTGMVTKRKDVGHSMVQIEVICVECGLMRIDLISPQTGGLYHRKYLYPDGYRTERTNRNYWRKAFVQEATRRARSGPTVIDNSSGPSRRR